MPEEVVEYLRNVEKIGQERYQKILKERYIDQTIPASDRIPQSPVKLFKYGLNKKTQPSVQKTVEASHKQQLQQIVDIITCHQNNRPVTAETLSRENNELPPTMTKNGKMFHGNKSELLSCIVPVYGEIDETEELRDSACTVALLDGSVVFQFLRPPQDIIDVEDWIIRVVIPYIESYFSRGYTRVDLVFDRYLKVSFKSDIRKSRGSGKALIVGLKTKRPTDWGSFLRVDSNKEALFSLVAEYLIEHLRVPQVHFT